MTNVTLETLNIHVTQQNDSHDDTVTPNKTSKVLIRIYIMTSQKNVPQRASNFLILYHRCTKTCKQIKQATSRQEGSLLNRIIAEFRVCM